MMYKNILFTNAIYLFSFVLFTQIVYRKPLEIKKKTFKAKDLC